MVPFRYVALFPTLLLLAGCGDLRETLVEKYTGERKGDVVTGPRRPPLLNPGYAALQRPAAPPAPIAPIVPQPPQNAKAAPTPYEQYDADGNDTTRTNYLKEWFGDKKEAAPPAPVVPMAQAAPGGRKSFRGAAASVEPAAPVVIAPQTSPVPQWAPEEDNGVFLPEPQKRAQAAPVGQLSQLQPAAGGYPHLATVPKTPSELVQMKREAPASQRDLQKDYNAAMEQKRVLEQEPTELAPVTLPKVEGMLEEIDEAIHGNTPIVQAAR